jgi:hypothetical protein
MKAYLEWRCRLHVFLTSALDEGKWSASHPGPWYPLESRLGRPQSRSRRGGEEKNSQSLPGFEPPTIQPVAQRCTTELDQNIQNKNFARRFEVFMLMKVQIVVSRFVMPSSEVDGGDKVLQNVDILPYHYMKSETRRPRLE